MMIPPLLSGDVYESIAVLLHGAFGKVIKQNLKIKEAPKSSKTDSKECEAAASAEVHIVEDDWDAE